MSTYYWTTIGDQRVTVMFDSARRRYVWVVGRPGLVVDRSPERGYRRSRGAVRAARRLWPVTG